MFDFFSKNHSLSTSYSAPYFTHTLKTLVQPKHGRRLPYWSQALLLTRYGDANRTVLRSFRIYPTAPPRRSKGLLHHKDILPLTKKYSAAGKALPHTHVFGLRGGKFCWASDALSFFLLRLYCYEERGTHNKSARNSSSLRLTSSGASLVTQ